MNKLIELKKETQAPLFICKKALQESNDDYQKALELVIKHLQSIRPTNNSSDHLINIVKVFPNAEEAFQIVISTKTEMTDGELLDIQNILEKYISKNLLLDREIIQKDISFITEKKFQNNTKIEKLVHFNKKNIPNTSKRRIQSKLS